MSGTPVRWTIDGSCARIWLCRPEVLNALNEESYIGLARAFDAVEENDAVSVAVIDGGGCRAFSAGADLKFMRGLSGAKLRRFIELSWRIGERIARSSVLTIARLNGYTLGGGAELALACDLRVAAADTAIGFPEMTYGSVPGSGAAQRLQTLIGPARAIEMMVGGRRFSASEAHTIGLVNAVADSQADVDAWLSPFLSRPREAIAYMKAAMLLKNEPHAAAAFHGLISATRQADADYRARTQAFDREHG
ncbi:Short-chain-enoyl-CoA hydratase [Ensifer psoraleae]|uniref:enoyl-CoA hydratase/isomerase family protein n=1 Tax=Sinorhizobium psoraleae TaxID=520838 RepID=UPI00156A39F4|nr:enoyl-CoA hydratase/isomerase family protein [Sinorhizobium psoraleae]NRP72178.1 Short-chain-enoyl-CoA hydratase [Sinorhizobium psoraleae]